MRYLIGSVTDVGNVRQQNQDRLLVRQNADEVLLVVADGMGGLACGERASALAVQTLEQWWRETPRTGNQEELSAVLDTAIYEAHRKIYYLSEQLAQRTGTTLSLLYFQGESYIIKQIGDSRIYRLRNGELRQLTIDQTWSNRMVQSGTLTPEEASRHRLRHALVNALGASPELDIAAAYGMARRGDRYLLCSDGFYGELSSGELMGHLYGEPQKVLQALQQKIKIGAARDNLSAILCQIL